MKIDLGKKQQLNMRQFDELCEKGIIKLDEGVIDVIVAYIEEMLNEEENKN